MTEKHEGGRNAKREDNEEEDMRAADSSSFFKLLLLCRALYFIYLGRRRSGGGRPNRGPGGGGGCLLVLPAAARRQHQGGAPGQGRVARVEAGRGPGAVEARSALGQLVRPHGLRAADQRQRAAPQPVRDLFVTFRVVSFVRLFVYSFFAGGRGGEERFVKSAEEAGHRRQSVG